MYPNSTISKLPLFCVMVSVIDALENDREPQAGGLTGANTEITHPAAAACLVFDCGAAAGPQPGISARTVSPLDATVHRNRPRFVLISPLSQSVHPPRIFRVCAPRADCHVPPQELTAWQTKNVDKQKASGEAVSTAWSNVWKDKVQAYSTLE